MHGPLASTLLTTTRLVVSIVFISVGVDHLVHHVRETEAFDRWGLPFPAAANFATGSVEIVLGVLLLLGIATRYVAAVFVCIMIGALLTAGRVDGGSQLVVPPILGTASLVLAAFGGGRFQLRPTLRTAT